VFEDAVSGVEAAVAAGMMCIGIAPPERAHALIAAGAAHTIPDFSSVIYRDGALGLLDGITLPLGARRPDSLA
jgi:beta-phosphoglucomutase-like phosphatase (HAD superfamily)